MFNTEYTPIARPTAQSKFGTATALASLSALALLLCANLNQPSFAQPENIHEKRVPKGLSAEDYYELAKDYKTKGLTEDSRKCLNNAYQLDPKGIGKRAMIYLRAYLPRYPATDEAVALNVRGFNAIAAGQLPEAEKTFKLCVKKHPNFDWGWSNLGYVYLEEGRVAEAKTCLNQALKINPNLLNGWLHLARAYKMERNRNLVRTCIERAESIDPENRTVAAMRSEL